MICINNIDNLINICIMICMEQGGWMAANAALGYLSSDLTSGRNIASDLQSMNR